MIPKIAIQGHSTRGKEVIQILENLGGKNKYELEGYSSTQYYFINSLDNIIYCHNLKFINKSYKTYILNQFKKEFPLKLEIK